MRRFTLSYRLLTGLLGIVLVSGCNDPSPLTLDQVPQGELKTDTLSLNIYSVAETPYRTDVLGTRLSSGDALSATDNLIGEIRDSVFGTSSAALFMSFYPTDFLVLSQALENQGQNITVDSVFLVLKPIEIIGDTFAQVSFRIHPLLDTLVVVQDIESEVTDAGYFYTDSTAVDAGINYALFPEFQFSADTTTIDSQIVRLQLSNAVGEAIFQAGFEGLGYLPDSNLTFYLERNRAFRTFFPGLYINFRPTGVSPLESRSRGVMWEIDHDHGAGFETGGKPTDSTETILEVYISYQDTVGGFPHDTSGVFYFNSSNRSDIAQRYSYYTRYSTSGLPVEPLLNGIQDLNAENLFIQSADGFTIRFRLPELSSFPFPLNPPPIITRAELVLTLDTTFYQDSTTNLLFPAPVPQTTFSNSDLELYEVIEGTDVENLYGGTISRMSLNSLENDVFPLSSTIQNYLLGANPNREFVIVYRTKHFRNRRGIYCGPGHPDPAKRPKLVITYLDTPEVSDD